MRLSNSSVSWFPVKVEDVARLSPLVFDHINLLGNIPFCCRYVNAAAQLHLSEKGGFIRLKP